MSIAQLSATGSPSTDDSNAWEGFAAGPWLDDIDVRDFIQPNCTPYLGDASVLTGATERTARVRSAITAMLPEERSVTSKYFRSTSSVATSGMS